MDAYCRTTDTIILGDFNASPDDPEIQGRWCFSFAGQKANLSGSSHGKKRGEFRAIRPAGQGTYRWNPGDGMDPSWRCYDFIVASKHLAGLITCQSETHLRDKQLQTPRGTPHYSDHLPVTGVLSLQRGRA